VGALLSRPRFDQRQALRAQRALLGSPLRRLDLHQSFEARAEGHRSPRPVHDGSDADDLRALQRNDPLVVREAIAAYKPKFILMMVGMFIPFQAVIIPLFIFLKTLGLQGTLTGIVIVHVIYGLPFATLIMRNYYETIPDGIVEAAAGEVFHPLVAHLHIARLQPRHHFIEKADFLAVAVQQHEAALGFPRPVRSTATR
jgi:hypothetical protein